MSRFHFVYIHTLVVDRSRHRHRRCRCRCHCCGYYCCCCWTSIEICFRISVANISCAVLYRLSFIVFFFILNIRFAVFFLLFNCCFCCWCWSALFFCSDAYFLLQFIEIFNIVKISSLMWKILWEKKQYVSKRSEKDDDREGERVNRCR